MKVQMIYQNILQERQCFVELNQGSKHEGIP